MTQSSHNGSFRTEQGGVAVQDLATGKFLCESHDDDMLTTRFSSAYFFASYDEAVKEGERFCGRSGFATICVGPATIPRPCGVLGNVIF